MGTLSMLGRKLVVDYSLLKDLNISITCSDAAVLISVEGSIMESAKVFRTMQANLKNHTIAITIYASLAFWDRCGSPEFRAVRKLALVDGVYEIVYCGKASKKTFLKRFEIAKAAIREIEGR